MDVGPVRVRVRAERGGLRLLPTASAEHGRFVVVRTQEAEQAVLRRLVQESGRSFLEALNPAWPNRIVKLDKRAKVSGVVIFKGEVLG